jgi:hypothetical protein
VNARGEAFLSTRVHSRPHRTTGVAPIERLPLEGPMMAVLPRVRFVAAYVEARRVHPVLALLEWRASPTRSRPRPSVSSSSAGPPSARICWRSAWREGVALHRVALLGAGASRRLARFPHSEFPSVVP